MDVDGKNDNEEEADDEEEEDEKEDQEDEEVIVFCFAVYFNLNSKYSYLVFSSILEILERRV